MTNIGSKIFNGSGESLLNVGSGATEKSEKQSYNNQSCNNLVVLVHSDKILFKSFTKRLSYKVKPLPFMSREGSFAKRLAEMTNSKEIADFLSELSLGDGLMIHLGDIEDYEDDCEEGTAIELDLLLLEHSANVAYLKNMSDEPIHVYTPFLKVEHVMPCDVLCVNTKKASVFVTNASADSKAMLSENCCLYGGF